MIIHKNKDKTYLTDRGNTVQRREDYQRDIETNQAIEEPSDKELIELGKEHHPYYMKELAIQNLQNNIEEIDEFETKLRTK